MEQPIQSLCQKQRDVFARLLQDAKARAEAEFESEGSSDDQVESEVLPKLAAERGATPLIEKLRSLRKEVEDAEGSLERLGFSCDEDGISLKWKAPRDLKQALEAAKRSARKQRQAGLKKYDLAILSVWAAKDAQEAKKIVEELL